ncbi:MAG: hypothetical protein GC162_03320 [Planctomycetes bacterium]|nr:hypothetical protein [Planctomycetota bacterium]
MSDGVQGQVGRYGKISIAGACVMTMAMGLNMAHAASVATDNFESYSAGSQLAGLNGGTGFSAAWSVPSIPAANITIVNQSLSYLGGSIGATGGTKAVQLTNSNSTAEVAFTRNLTTAQSGTVYYSFLYRTSGLSNSAVGDEFFQTGLNNAASNPNISAVDNVSGGQRQDAIRAGTSGGVQSGIPLVNDVTYLIVVKAQKTGSNYDKLTLYVNPTNITESYNTSTVTTSSSGISSITDFVTRKARLSSGDTFILDNIAVGTTFADVISRSTPLLSEDFNGTVGTQPTGFTAFTSGAGMVSAIATATEYEQKNNSGTNAAVASYSVLNDIDKGAWRDVTVETNTRYSGAGTNDNGLILRARGISSTSSGDYYQVRMNNNVLELVRYNNGVATVVGGSGTISGISSGATSNRLLRVTIENVSDAGTDNVRVRANLYSGTTDASGITASFDLLDTSANAITRAGGVGYRTDNSASGTRATFDSLRAYNENPHLLFYDDYYDNQAIRYAGFNSGAMSQAVTGQQYTFTSSSAAGLEVGIASVDFDSFTSTTDWTNVMVTSVVRFSNNEIAAGLIARETGTSTSANGSWYTFRIDRDSGKAEVGRQTGAGGFGLLDSTTIGLGAIPFDTDIYLKFVTQNLGGNVQLVAVASLNADFSNAFYTKTILDTDVNRILGPGSAGMRVFTRDDVGTVTFDNFTVIAVPTPGTCAMLGVGLVTLLRRRARSTR